MLPLLFTLRAHDVIDSHAEGIVQHEDLAACHQSPIDEHINGVTSQNRLSIGRGFVMC